ncbi:LacI family DNA-binding transcriptional regulator [Pseudactinotalea suaedae]|uniref:LacI family DNA-binding transcriptional regulator n=1 Tax=Pseudactinotalea suaedae TaxID=1524924 RepID=UPI001F4F4632|nr:LacI family DNA-binding transcriptional regulator [Pseudactinotalea suaedae]
MNKRRSAPTLEDVAAEADVSRATVSRVVNADPRVSASARERVLAAIEALGYAPNRAARSLVTRQADSIAVVIPESDARVFSDPFFAGTLHGIATALSRTDLQMVLVMGQPDDGDGRLSKYLRGGHTDGAIITSHHRRDEFWRTAQAAGLPMVFLGRPFAPMAGMPYVDVDNVHGAALAVKHLVEQGRTRIATIAGPSDMVAGADRLTGWRRELRAAGLPDDAVVHGDFSAAAGAAAMAELLANHPDLDGVFVASDVMAVAALETLRRHGRSVPDDVSVVGFDNTDAAVEATPALTTIVNPIVPMARQAVGLLLGLLDGDQVPAAVTLSTELVVRSSSIPADRQH